MFSRNVQRLRFVPENGMSVLVVGNVDVYERDGVYQIIASDIQPVGVGALHTGMEQLKEKLSKLGVFDISAKKKIPLMPKKIAVVTSLTGAALQDILNILSRRYPVCAVEIYPAQVQGESAPDSICRALVQADSSGADTILLARGGGSLEDLMPFNTEKVAMTVYQCSIPVISAVGHETDTTLADYAADLRAPTPSAAAELASPRMSELIGSVDYMIKKLNDAFAAFVNERELLVQSALQKIKLHSPEKRVENDLNILIRTREKLDMLANRKISQGENKLDKYYVQLSALSPLNVLDRGYTITTKNEKVVYSGDDLEKNDLVEIRFKDTVKSAQIL
jgi:exodeoxyribonuclease VII large subunit